MGKKTKMKFQNLILVFLLLISYSQQMKVQDTFEEVAYESAEAEEEEKFQTIEEDEESDIPNWLPWIHAHELSYQQIDSISTIMEAMANKRGKGKAFLERELKTPKRLRGLSKEQIQSAMDIKKYMKDHPDKDDFVRAVNHSKIKFAGFTKKQSIGIFQIEYSTLRVSLEEKRAFKKGLREALH